MGKVFEDYFSELQADMISICLEYVSGKADNIYIYCSFENGIISSDFFYRIGEEIFERHELNKSGAWLYEVSLSRQDMVLEVINENLKKMNLLCSNHGREMPTEMKLMYDVKTNKFEAEYSYEVIYTRDTIKTADDISNEWLEKIRKEIK